MAVLHVRRLGRVEYQGTWRAMRRFTEERDRATPDELWLLEHPPVFTLGRAARPGHLLQAGDIPVIPVDRGGQITYHGPGQLIAYVMLDLRRLELGVRPLVSRLEQAVIDLLQAGGVSAQRRAGAPGVYVRESKVAALGLRVRKGCTYHGLALNVRMDLSAFERIDPCGYPGLQVTQMADLGVPWGLQETAERLRRELVARLGYASQTDETDLA